MIHKMKIPTKNKMSKTDRHLRIFKNAGFRSKLLRENKKTHTMFPTKSISSQIIFFILSPTIPGTARHGKSIPSKHKYVNINRNPMKNLTNPV